MSTPSPERKLGPYELIGLIGKGGMGEVYKARDPRLDRTVAIKVSNAEFTDRFAREARTVAQLNHPRICTLHDVGPNYLVMEFVDGAPLQGPLPLDKAIDYAKQILDALDAAHRKGIVHRDLKPANILVTKQGIKLVDFGLARMTTALKPDDATVVALSGAGEISGTLQYMAPEQLEGKESDPRSDIFAFGLVFYEMLTGKRAFDSPTQAGVIASILKDQPRPVRELQPVTSPALESILKTCLEKDPESRWQSARDVRHALDLAVQQGSPAEPALVKAASSLPWRIAAGVFALVALGLAGWIIRPKPVPPAEVTRFQVPVPDKTRLGGYISWSPDGRRFAITTVANDGVWIRDLDALEWRRLEGTDNVGGLFWSPDSRYLGFSQLNQIKKIVVSGGPPQTLCTAPVASAGSGSWNRDGVIIFGGRAGSPLWKVSAAGGVPVPITKLDTSKEVFHALPTFLPDGKHFVYFKQGPAVVSGIYAGSIDNRPEDQPQTRILQSPLAAPYVNGYLFFPRDNTLMAQPFDAAGLRLTGEAVPVAEHLGFSGATGLFSVSPAGNLAWRPGVQSSVFALTWLDREGKPAGTVGQPGPDQIVSLAPDGNRAVVRSAPIGQLGNLWTIDIARNIRSLFTFETGIGSWGVWSPDSTMIAYAGGERLDTIFAKPSTGAADAKLLLKEPGIQHLPTSWSRDGRYLLYSRIPAGNNGSDLWVLPLDGGKPAQLLSNRFSQVEAAFSPDMRWIAFSSNESGRLEVYVRPFVAAGPGGAPALGNGKWQLSRDGGDAPKWTADGKQVIFEAGTAKFSVAVRANGAAFEAGPPQHLFGPIPTAGSDMGWDVTGDGKRFLVAMPQGVPTTELPISVVLNWPALLNKK